MFWEKITATSRLSLAFTILLIWQQDTYHILQSLIWYINTVLIKLVLCAQRFYLFHTLPFHFLFSSFLFYSFHFYFLLVSILFITFHSFSSFQLLLHFHNFCQLLNTFLTTKLKFNDEHQNSGIQLYCCKKIKYLNQITHMYCQILFFWPEYHTAQVKESIINSKFSHWKWLKIAPFHTMEHKLLMVNLCFY